MAKKTRKSDDAKLDVLRELVAEGAGNGNGAEGKKTDRRAMLRMAGAAVLGAAGMAAVKIVPAAASNGGNMILGNSNGASATTSLGGTAALAVGFEVQASSGTGGLFTSTTGYDVALGFPFAGGVTGSGRLGMVARLDTGAMAPNIAPAFAASTHSAATFEHELVRGNDGSIWASTAALSGANQTRWKRVNAVRVDSSDGLGSPFKPKRVIDTRVGAIKGVGSMTPVTVAGVGTLTSKIPADAIAVIGNLTAVAYTGGGFLAIMPGGIVKGPGAGQYNPAVDPSSVNFIVGQGAIANSFVCGLGTGLSAGKVQVYVAGHSSHFIIDITGYMQ